MTTHRLVRRCGAAVLLALGAACARASDLVVLLPDPETGALGQATVRGEGGEVALTTAGEGTRVRAAGAPSAPAVVPKSDIDRLFGAALASRPQAARQFTLYFVSGDTLTPQSTLELANIIAEVRSRRSPEVSVIGHTDRDGDDLINARVGLRRAQSIRTALMQSGLAAELIDVSSHGETDPVVRTADGVVEPRNRRVEVTVR